jgi:hypothetical protein
MSVTLNFKNQKSMKKNLLISILIVLCLSCSTENPTLKTETVTEYSTKNELGELVKNKVKVRYSIGFYPNGTQKFFVGLIGYSTNNDTTKYKQVNPNETKKIDNKTFIYNSKKELLGVSIKKGDTIFFYNAADLENPASYSIFDKERIKVEAEFLLGVKKTYTQAKYNKYGACTYAIIQVDYEPSNYDRKYSSEIELARKHVEKQETTIFEAKYEYY